MSVSIYDFAAALPDLRPALHSTLQNRYPCQPEDAEDLVEDAITDACQKLDNYQPENGSLLNWLKGFLLIRIMRERDRAAHCPQTVPLETATDLPTGYPLGAPQVSPRYVADAAIRKLPGRQRYIVGAWLDGYSLRQIAQDYGLHRNTVGDDLRKAFNALRAQVPADQYLTFAVSDFDMCARVRVYHKPPGSSARWKRSLPRDITITLRGNTEDRSRSDRRVRALGSERSPRKVPL